MSDKQSALTPKTGGEGRRLRADRRPKVPRGGAGGRTRGAGDLCGRRVGSAEQRTVENRRAREGYCPLRGLARFIIAAEATERFATYPRAERKMRVQIRDPLGFP